VKGVASKLIEQHQLDDTFYIVDLANVVRLFKVGAPVPTGASGVVSEAGPGSQSLLTHHCSVSCNSHCGCWHSSGPVVPGEDGANCARTRCTPFPGVGAGHGMPCLPPIPATDDSQCQPMCPSRRVTSALSMNRPSGGARQAEPGQPPMRHLTPRPAEAAVSGLPALCIGHVYTVS
jgi:hypothetical protein